MPDYHFPEKNKFAVRDVLAPSFDIEPYWKKLYVDLDEVRGTRQRETIQFDLGMEDGELTSPAGEFVKIIFSGHMGCGKTTELRQLHQEVNSPRAYLSVFIDFQENTSINQFEPEDFFVFLIAGLVACLETSAITYDRSAFDQIAAEWLEEGEVREELSRDYKFIHSGDSSFWSSTMRGALSDLLSSGSTTVRAIRRVIKTRAAELLNKLNSALDDVRSAVQTAGAGRDLLFIIDNSEKMHSDKYHALFIENPLLVRDLKAHLICSVPIDSFYDIEASKIKDLYQPEPMPMIRVNERSVPALKQVISKRIDADTFFEPGVLDFFAQKSGGCLRQLFRLVGQAVRQTRGAKINQAEAEKAALKLGQELRERLSQRHMQVLLSGQYDTGDREVRQMLYGLQLLKYNGDSHDIVPNPLLLPYLSNG